MEYSSIAANRGRFCLLVGSASRVRPAAGFALFAAWRSADPHPIAASRFPETLRRRGLTESYQRLFEGREKRCPPSMVSNVNAYERYSMCERTFGFRNNTFSDSGYIKEAMVRRG